jgi:hypothetical protein
MAESPRRLDLRLTISTGAPYRAVAVELAGKFAEFVGATPSAAKDLSGSVAASIDRLAAAAPAAPMALDISAQEHELVVTLQSGATTTRAACPLPD